MKVSHLLVGSALLACAGVAQAAVISVSDSNILSGKTTAVSSTLGPDWAVQSNLVDGTQNLWASNYEPKPKISISGFDSQIDTLRLFPLWWNSSDWNATSIKIGYSNTVTTSLNASDYTMLGGATPTVYSLSYPLTSADGQVYDQLTSLNIPAGTKSLFIDATGPSYVGFGEIQAVAIPEPASLSLLALSGLALLRRRR